MATPVFRDYDQKALDAEYNNRVKVKDAMQWMARFGGESARARAELPLSFDVAYGPHHAERLDVFPAARPGLAPVHVFIHGGYWQRMDKADFSYVARGLRPAGVVTVVVNYGLVPSIDLDTLVGQCRAAVAFVHRHARDWGGDPDRISVSGHSAGGHLVAMLLATDWGALGAPADVLKGGCAISGLYDLEPIRLCYLNEVLRLDAGQARRNSPVLLPPQTCCPVMVTVGERETEAFHRQSRAYAEALRRASVPCELTVQQGLDHFAIIMAMTDAANPAVSAIRAWLGLPGAAA
jgi:arylformamidase